MTEYGNAQRRILFPAIEAVQGLYVIKAGQLRLLYTCSY